MNVLLKSVVSMSLILIMNIGFALFHTGSSWSYINIIGLLLGPMALGIYMGVKE